MPSPDEIRILNLIIKHSDESRAENADYRNRS
jgi:hypothetical protein